MKHAAAAALDVLEPLLAQIRGWPELREKTRGVFYRNGRAWLHFHEDPAGLFADLLTHRDWLRLPVNEPAEREILTAAIENALRAP